MDCRERGLRLSEVLKEKPRDGEDTNKGGSHGHREQQVGQGGGTSRERREGRQ